MSEVLRNFVRDIRKCLDSVNDPLPFKVSNYRILNHEVPAELTNLCLHYLRHWDCPSEVVYELARIITDEIRASGLKSCESDTIAFLEKVYEPLKLLQTVQHKVLDIIKRFDDSPETIPLVPSFPRHLFSISAIKNARRTMEDKHVIVEDLNQLYHIRDVAHTSYFAVLDGHAGTEAACYAATYLHANIANSQHYASNLPRAIHDAFLMTDHCFIKKSTIEELASGTTVVCSVVRDNVLHVAWLGDSEAVLVCNRTPHQLVVPHKPSQTSEKLRVESLGGHVMFYGTWRVNGQLAISRAIGDMDYKPFVSGAPDLVTVELDSEAEFLVLGCDGLWDGLNEQQASDVVFEHFQKNPGDVDGVSKSLIKEARNKGSVDNITVIVVLFKPIEYFTNPPPPKDVYKTPRIIERPSSSFMDHPASPAEQINGEREQFPGAGASKVFSPTLFSSLSEQPSNGKPSYEELIGQDGQTLPSKIAWEEPTTPTVDEVDLENLPEAAVEDDGDSDDDWAYYEGGPTTNQQMDGERQTVTCNGKSSPKDLGETFEVEFGKVPGPSSEQKIEYLEDPSPEVPKPVFVTQDDVDMPTVSPIQPCNDVIPDHGRYEPLDYLNVEYERQDTTPIDRLDGDYFPLVEPVSLTDTEKNVAEPTSLTQVQQPFPTSCVEFQESMPTELQWEQKLPDVEKPKAVDDDWVVVDSSPKVEAEEEDQIPVLLDVKPQFHSEPFDGHILSDLKETSVDDDPETEEIVSETKLKSPHVSELSDILSKASLADNEPNIVSTECGNIYAQSAETELVSQKDEFESIEGKTNKNVLLVNENHFEEPEVKKQSFLEDKSNEICTDNIGIPEMASLQSEEVLVSIETEEKLAHTQTENLEQPQIKAYSEIEDNVVCSQVEEPLLHSRAEEAVPASQAEEVLPHSQVEEALSHSQIEETLPVSQVEETKPISQVEEETKPISQLEESKPISQVEETQPILQVEETQPILQVEETQPILQVEETQPISQVEETQPISQVEEAQPISQVEETQPISQVEESQPISRVEENLAQKQIEDNLAQPLSEKYPALSQNEENQLLSKMEDIQAPLQTEDKHAEETQKALEKEVDLMMEESSVPIETTEVQPLVNSEIDKLSFENDLLLSNHNAVPVVSEENDLEAIKPGLLDADTTPIEGDLSEAKVELSNLAIGLPVEKLEETLESPASSTEKTSDTVSLESSLPHAASAEEASTTKKTTEVKKDLLKDKVESHKVSKPTVGARKAPPTRKPASSDTKRPLGSEAKRPTTTAAKKPLTDAKKQSLTGAKKAPLADAKKATLTDTKKPTLTDTKKPTVGAVRKPASVDLRKPASTGAVPKRPVSSTSEKNNMPAKKSDFKPLPAKRVENKAALAKRPLHPTMNVEAKAAKKPEPKQVHSTVPKKPLTSTLPKRPTTTRPATAGALSHSKPQETGKTEGAAPKKPLTARTPISPHTTSRPASATTRKSDTFRTKPSENTTTKRPEPFKKPAVPKALPKSAKETTNKSISARPTKATSPKKDIVRKENKAKTPTTPTKAKSSPRTSTPKSNAPELEIKETPLQNGEAKIVADALVPEAIQEGGCIKLDKDLANCEDHL